MDKKKEEKEEEKGKGRLKGRYGDEDEVEEERGRGKMRDTATRDSARQEANHTEWRMGKKRNNYKVSYILTLCGHRCISIGSPVTRTPSGSAAGQCRSNHTSD